ncbi:uncharacterized protein LOC131153395 isoform X2 [Malania oleifera]|uniref:uncharacterized protein LOC131153395 isoform X2 n=1 Tax=Malania oleifera TaxID=397392 RepID=UPI0025AE2FC8|nr:uncharacterized protein LOC131153395 isoform X2 [Malania oleifera]
MCSSPFPSPLVLPTNRRSFLRSIRTDVSIFNSLKASLDHHRSRKHRLRLAASVAERNLGFSWFAPDNRGNDDCGGWAIVESPVEKKTGKKRLPTFVFGVIGISVTALIAAMAHFSMTRKGFKFQFSSALHALPGLLMHDEIKANGTEKAETDGSDVEALVLETNPDYRCNATSDTVSSAVEKLERVIIPVAVDSTQQEALLVLKKLKIIEENVKADELCTRREYARWLVQANSLLERNPKHRIVPSVLLSGFIVAAFDDVSIFDPDFWSIQALAEAGVIPSKLSVMNPNSDLDALKGERGVYFFPERFVSRQDLINWKAQLEYELVPGVEEKIVKAKVDFMDVREVSLNASPELFVDIMAGDSSILRKVFGQSKRFQPKKPSTKAQAVVAVASGRMTESIYAELSRLEAENSSRKAEMEEIRLELLGKGDIQSFWDEKLEKEMARGLEVERAYIASVHNLELEKIVQENNLAKYLKEKAAIDCQRQLLLSLREEVSEMSERLAWEKANYIAEQRKLQDMHSDLQTKWEGMWDAKSLLEAEKEAVRILRSWVEDEARKNQARAKVLEEVGRRWKWESQA